MLLTSNEIVLMSLDGCLCESTDDFPCLSIGCDWTSSYLRLDLSPSLVSVLLNASESGCLVMADGKKIGFGHVLINAWLGFEASVPSTCHESLKT